MVQRFAFNLKDIFGGHPVDFDLSKIGPALQKAADFMIGLAGVVALIFLIWGGILYITSGGSSEQAGKAKGTITWALIGLLLVLAAWAIVQYFAGIVIKN